MVNKQRGGGFSAAQNRLTMQIDNEESDSAAGDTSSRKAAKVTCYCKKCVTAYPDPTAPQRQLSSRTVRRHNEKDKSRGMGLREAPAGGGGSGSHACSGVRESRSTKWVALCNEGRECCK